MFNEEMKAYNKLLAQIKTACKCAVNISDFNFKRLQVLYIFLRNVIINCYNDKLLYNL